MDPVATIGEFTLETEDEEEEEEDEGREYVADGEDADPTKPDE